MIAAHDAAERDHIAGRTVKPCLLKEKLGISGEGEFAKQKLIGEQVIGFIAYGLLDDRRADGFCELDEPCFPRDSHERQTQTVCLADRLFR